MSGNDLAMLTSMRPLAFIAAVAVSACASPQPALFDPATTTVAIDRTGGLEPAPAAGSTCILGQETYTYVIATETLTWSICRAPTPDGVYTQVPGQANLSTSEAAALLDVLRALQPPKEGCSSDAHATYTFSTPHGAVIVDNGICMAGDNDVSDALYAITG